MSVLHPFNTSCWNQTSDAIHQQEAIKKLEQGNILFFPQLAFQLLPNEHQFLTPTVADPHAKNVSYHAERNQLWGVQGLADAEHLQLKNMLDRFSRHALALVRTMLPSYVDKLIIARTSFRPVQISNRKTSYRKDDKRLHVDAFPSAPNQGKRILRVFSNINPKNEDRIWRVGEPFEKVAQQFIPSISKPFPGFSHFLRMLRITKSHRTLYDHFMLQMHDRMKADEHYQKFADQCEVRFPKDTTWIVQTDHVSHAAMQGQFVLEQTFYLPVNAMQNESQSPLRILEKMLNQSLA